MKSKITLFFTILICFLLQSTVISRIAIGWPGFLHIYFDIFSGCIQTYVFCMLTMVFTRDKMGD